MTIDDALKTIVSRNNFYRDGYRLMLRISFIQIIAILLLVGGLVTMILTAKVQYVYFATTTDGRIINIVPLNEPYIPDGVMVAWVADTTKRVLTLSFSDFRQRLQDVAYNFTPNGWTTFSKALQDARILELIENRKMVTELTINAAPEILEKGEKNGVYSWVLKLPVTLSFKGEDAPQSLQGNLRILVSRVSTLQHPKGVGIDRFLFDASGVIK
jgi:intracellular multiplication protein IcmL